MTGTGTGFRKIKLLEELYEERFASKKAKGEKCAKVLEEHIIRIPDLAIEKENYIDRDIIKIDRKGNVAIFCRLRVEHEQWRSYVRPRLCFQIRQKGDSEYRLAYDEHDWDFKDPDAEILVDYFSQFGWRVGVKKWPCKNSECNDINRIVIDLFQVFSCGDGEEEFVAFWQLREMKSACSCHKRLRTNRTVVR